MLVKSNLVGFALFAVLGNRGRFVRMSQPAFDKEVPQYTKPQQEERTDEAESHDPTEYQFGGTHRFGRDGVNRPTFDFVRQTKGANEQTNEKNEDVRNAQNEADIKLGRILSATIEKPTGEHQHHDEDADHDKDFAADGFHKRQLAMAKSRENRVPGKSRTKKSRMTRATA